LYLHLPAGLDENVLNLLSRILIIHQHNTWPYEYW